MRTTYNDFFSLAHVSSANQGAIKIYWLNFWGALVLSVFILQLRAFTCADKTSLNDYLNVYSLWLIKKKQKTLVCEA